MSGLKFLLQKDREIVFQNQACLFAHHTSCHTVHVWCIIDAVGQAALYSVSYIAVWNARPACVSKRVQFRETGRSLSGKNHEVQFFNKKVSFVFSKPGRIIFTHRFLHQCKLSFPLRSAPASAKDSTFQYAWILGVSAKELDKAARLPLWSGLFLTSARLGATLSVTLSRSRLFFKNFAYFQASRFWFCMIAQLGLSYIFGPDISHLTVDPSHFAFCSCSFPKLAQISSAISFHLTSHLSHPGSAPSLFHSFLTPIQLAVSSFIKFYSRRPARQGFPTARPHTWPA